MHFLAATLVSALVGAASLARADGDLNRRCPTMTATSGVCPTCPLRQCLAYETITQRSGCPSRIPTSTTSYPCRGHKCPRGCASTSYVVVTPTPTHPAHSCPTVTRTRSICSTCVRPMCIEVKTLTCQTGCPVPVRTAFTDYPCHRRCPGGCDTQYVLDPPGCRTPRTLSSSGSSTSMPHTSPTSTPTSMSQ